MSNVLIPTEEHSGVSADFFYPQETARDEARCSAGAEVAGCSQDYHRCPEFVASLVKN